MEEAEEKEGEEEERCEGRKSVGRKAPKEPTKVDKEENERARIARTGAGASIA